MIAAAVAVAVSGAGLNAVLSEAKAAIEPAAQLAKAPASGVAMKIAFDRAVSAGTSAATHELLTDRLQTFDVSTATQATGSVAAVFGILAATGAHAFDSIQLAISAGDDTHTTAMMAGAIAGAMHGCADIPESLVRQLRNVNQGIDLS